MDLELDTPPAADAALSVVAVADMRRHMRLSTTSRDDIIEQTIRDAVSLLHGPGGSFRRTILPCTWKLWMPSFPDATDDNDGSTIELPLPPVTAVSEIGYLDQNGAPQLLDPSAYAVVPGDIVGKIVLLSGNFWPLTQEHPRAVWCKFSAGYDWTALTHPHCQQIKRAVKLLSAHFYENSEATIVEGRLTNASKKIEFGLDMITSQLRVPLRYV